MDSIRTVNSRVDLVHFIRDMKADLETGKGDWENATLERYLDAMAAWLEDSGHRGDIGHSNPWQFVANILVAARIYE